MAQGNIERVYYNHTPGVLITSSRAEFGTMTYALAAVVSVEAARFPANRGSGYALLVAGVIVGSFGVLIQGPAFIALGVGLAAIGVSSIKRAKDVYVVQIVTSAGQVQPYSSHNPDEIARIAYALKQAIVER